MSYWRQSNVDEMLLEDFAAKGFFPPKEVAGWRAPPPEHEEPHPEPHEVRRPRHDDVYPEYTPAESNKGWHGDLFYIRNPPEAPFPEFHGGRPVRDLSWTWGTPMSEKFLAREIKEVI
ncbi:hypothetical protein C2845_PM07G23000 [Panicum miliaceum]|uniref:Uncharacterized protein n=1 Tax=Panicum miliaceum TaxID=4540 RepID=A0A3L6SHK2_PANMI|nr:hypothetical protein C2845_PM07G23000 [Panicum miliaceum]